MFIMFAMISVVHAFLYCEDGFGYRLYGWINLAFGHEGVFVCVFYPLLWVVKKFGLY
jgi:hypothetical protein